MQADEEDELVTELLPVKVARDTVGPADVLDEGVLTDDFVVD